MCPVGKLPPISRAVTAVTVNSYLTSLDVWRLTIRSFVQYMEQSIAELELQVKAAASTSPLADTSAKLTPAANHGPSLSVSLADGTAPARAILSEAKLLSSDLELPYLDALYCGAHLPTPLDLKQTRLPVKGSSSPSIPIAVARRLFDGYIEKTLPQSPFFLTVELEDVFSAVYNYTPGFQRPDSATQFIALHVMAITIMSSKATDRSKASSLARSLHTAALNETEHMNTTCVRTLQCLLLSIQFAFLVPECGDLIHLVHEAMRMATELGIHQEDYSSIDNNGIGSLSFQHRLFWVVIAGSFVHWDPALTVSADIFYGAISQCDRPSLFRDTR